MKIMGIDTSMRGTGYAVLQERMGIFTPVEFGVIRNAPSLPHSECLRKIDVGICRLIETHHPDGAAIEGAFFFKNAKTALILGEARGAAITACARLAVPVFEYAPRTVKQGLTRFGGAGKGQVARMVMAIMKLSIPPPEDAADALAIAYTHIQNARGPAALRSLPL